jgi:hypothetical protein
MKWLKVLFFLAAFLVGTAGPGFAEILFFDNFDAYNGGSGALNYNFPNTDKWKVTNGTVDLIGNGFYDLLSGNGLYIDLDGSSNDAGNMTSRAINLTNGDYMLSFDLAGNNRFDQYDQVTVKVQIGQSSKIYSLAYNEPFQRFYQPFTINEDADMIPINILFSAYGGDNVGMLLDNVKLEDAPAVPIPGAIWLLGSGILGIIGYRKKVK